MKPVHYRDAVPSHDGGEGTGDLVSHIKFFEVHAENYMGEGGAPHFWLSKIREHFLLSVHGVCLSLGGMARPDKDHLARLKLVIDRYQPALISEHLAWCAHDGVFFNDLLAPPLSRETLHRTAAHIDETQNALGRRILVENPSRYLTSPAEISEPEFLNALASQTGCGLLLDVNNVFVSASNLGFCAQDYLDAIEANHVEEIHLAGHAIDAASGIDLRIDDHGAPVCDEVGVLYQRFIERAGPRPTLVEWDTAPPSLAIMNSEAAKAERWMRDALVRYTLKAAHNAGSVALGLDAAHV